jgi:hypothetical protein
MKFALNAKTLLVHAIPPPPPISEWSCKLYLKVKVKQIQLKTVK